jgi:nucleoid-associated protein YgaU
MKALTFSLLLGLGVGGAMGCSDDEAPEEAVKAEGGEAGEVAANPDGGGDEAKEEAKEASDDQLNADQTPPPSDDAPPAEESAPAPENADEQAAVDSDGAAPELPAEQESDAMLSEAETQAPVQEEAVAPPPPAPVQEQAEVTLQAPVQQAKVEKHTKFTPVSQNVGNGAKGSGGSYVVQPGDTLAGISYKVYGVSDMWHPLAMLNGINEPYRIFPGDEIQFDATNEHSKQFAQNQSHNAQSVTVKHGDTLSSIAQAVYGNAGHWKVLYAHNKDKIQDPNRIEVGMVLTYVSQGNATAASSDDSDVAPEQPVKKTKKAATNEAPAKKGKKTAGKTS